METPEKTDRYFSRSTAAWCVGALVVLAFVLRLLGLGFALPDDSPVDERVWESQLLTERGTPGPVASVYNLYYPDLVPRLCALVTPAVHPPRDCDPDAHRAAASRELLRLRFIVLLLSLLAIPATYRIARLMLGRRTSVLAAGFAATSLLAQVHAQEARPHAAAGAIVAIALLLLCAARRKPDIGRWIAAGLACSVAMSILQSSLALIPAILVAAILRAPSETGRQKNWLGPVACLLAMSTAVFFQPGFGALHSTRPAEAGAVKLAGHVVLFDQFNGSGFKVLFGQMWVSDPLMLVLASIGLVRFLCALIWRRDEMSFHKDVIVVLGHAVPYGLVLGAYALSFDRFMLPLLPIAGACAAAAVTGWTREPKRIALCAAALLFAVETAGALRYSMFRAAPDTGRLAAQWIEANIDPRTDKLAKWTNIQVPVLCKPSSVAENATAGWVSKLVWDHYLRRVPDDVLDRCGYDLTTIELPRDKAARNDLRRDADEFVERIPENVVILQRLVNYPLLERLHALIAARGTLLARFSPRRDGGEPFTPPDGEPFIWTALSMARTGPVVEIWRLR